MTVTHTSIRIYVACLAAYNNGILHGSWIDATESPDAMMDAIQKMLGCSPIPNAEEWAIHDYEGFDWQAAFKEQTMIGKTNALKHIRKYAVAGGPAWMGTTIAFFRPFFSMEMEYFPYEKVEDAWKWLGAEPIDTA